MFPDFGIRRGATVQILVKNSRITGIPDWRITPLARLGTDDPCMLIMPVHGPASSRAYPTSTSGKGSQSLYG
jgi:hypothetical protein